MNDLKFTTAGDYMKDDVCDGTCIINTEDQCWCGRKWDGEKMCVTKLVEIGDDTESKD